MVSCCNSVVCRVFLHSDVSRLFGMLMLTVCFGCCRCALELHAIARHKEECGGRFELAMTSQENRRFLAGIGADPKEYFAMLGRIDAETSTCSRASDRESIHEGIRRSVGFAKLNRMVFGVMEGWMEEQLRKQAAASAAEGSVYDSLALRSALASVMLLKGQCAEAAAMYEEILESAQRDLPDKNHPEIGEYECRVACPFTEF